MPDRMPEDLPDRMPEDMPDHMPEDMPDRMPNRMSEDMSDRMPEDLPVRKCINVMVGITRSKVIMNLAASRHWCPTGSRLDPDWIPTGSRLAPDWIPTGSRLAKSGAQKSKIGARLGPDGILTGSIDRQEPTPAPIFPFPDPPLPLFSFSAHQPCTNTPPLLHQNGKSSLKPNGGSTKHSVKTGSKRDWKKFRAEHQERVTSCMCLRVSDKSFPPPPHLPPTPPSPPPHPLPHPPSPPPQK